MPDQAFRLTSGAIDEGGAIPVDYSCDGQDTSPPLAWSGVPDGASGLALIVDDPDAGGFVHWAAFDLPAESSGELGEGASSGGGAPSQARNSFGKVGWGGPCPPSGTHHYRFRLIAVSEALGLSGTPDGAAVVEAAAARSIGEATLTGTYTRR